MQITEKHIFLNSTHEGFYIQFNPYEVGPYADGSSKVDVAAKDWKKYFEVNDLTKSIFGN